MMFSALRGVSAVTVGQVITRLVRWGFFDVSLLGSVRVFTPTDVRRSHFHYRCVCVTH
ncbi:MAG: hypothetical protein J1F20_00635 [Muribaculaceae bacterium]|nr:hypothetical protein [Muribaculaceae bacterium]